MELLNDTSGLLTDSDVADTSELLTRPLQQTSLISEDKRQGLADTYRTQTGKVWGQKEYSNLMWSSRSP